MANHKRRRAKHQRSGCLSCKPHKDDRGKNGLGAQTIQEHRARAAEAAGWCGDDFDWLGPDAEDVMYFGDTSHDIEPSGRQQDHGRAKKRPFVIEAKIVRSFGSKEWFTHGRYETRRQRDQAFARLTRVDADRPFGPIYEFRRVSMPAE